MPLFKDAVDKAGDTMTGSLVLASPATLTIGAMTQGSVLFVGASGVVSQDNTNLFFSDSNNRLGVGTTTPATTIHAKGRDGATSTVSAQATFDHDSVGTPAAGFGSAFDILMKSDTTVSRNAGRLSSAWVVATDASRTARTTVWAGDSGGFRDGFHVEADGTGANCGFFSQASYGGGRSVIAIPNAAVVPGSNPSGGGILYCEGGALKYRGSSGTVTTIANA